MQRIPAFQSFRAWLRDLPYTDPIQRRLAPVLQGFFVAVIGALLLAIVLAFIIIGTSWLTPTTIVTTVLFGAALALGLRLLRRGYLNWALGLIIATLLLTQARTLLTSGFLQNQQTLFTSVFLLMLTGFLLGRRSLILTAAVNFAIIALIALQEQVAIIAADPTAAPPTIARLTGFALTISLIVILLDLFATVFRGELAASLQRERDLEGEIAARKKVEQSLAAQREQYRVTLASIGDAVIATDTGGNVTFINEVAADLTGWSADEAVGKGLHQVFPIMNEHTRAPVENPLIRVLSDGVVVGLANHTVLLKRDGTLRPIADSGAPIRDDSGAVIGAVLVFRDVTEERKAEADLKESEERFRLMADNAPVLIWMAGLDKRRYFFNKQWFSFTGRTLEQEQGEGWTEGLHPDDYNRFMETYSTAFDKREAFTMEYRLRRADGEYRWLMVNGVPRFSPTGEFIGYIASCTDIHERIEAEERAQLLQTLTTALASALTAEDVAQVIVERGFKLLGVHLGVVALLDETEVTVAIVGRHGVPEAMLEPYQPLQLDAVTPLTAAIRSHEPVWIENLDDYQRLYPELAEQTRTAATQTQSIACLPLVVGRHMIGGISMSFRYPQHWDDERRALLLAVAAQTAQAMERAHLYHQAQLNAAVEERQRLARDLHDAVSQTLFSASIIAESLPTIMERNPTLGADQLGQLVTLNRASMSEMRTLLLELRPEAILKTNLSTLLQQLVDAARGRKNIAAHMRFDGTDEDIPANVHITLYRIAQESINNLLKHSGAKEFTVQLRAQPQHIELEIHDNGQGFDPHTPRPGFGLRNIRERAEAIGATLTLDSAPDSGTHITVRWNA